MMNPNPNTVANSLLSYQKFTPPYPVMNDGMHSRQVSEFNKENIS